VGEQQHPRRRLHLRRNPTRPQTTTRSDDLHLEGTCWHHAWAIAARVSSGNPARADGSTGRSVASASCPPRTSARLMASVTRLRHRSRQWTARPGSGRRSLFSSQLCLCPCWHRCLRLQLIAERPRVSLTKQGKPWAARPTEPRDSYASGIRIPHSSPSHEATHTWLSGSASRQASPSARNEEETWLHAKIHTCSGPTVAMNRHRHSRCHYKWNFGSAPAGTNNPHIGGPVGRQNADRWLTAARSGNSDNDLRSGRPNSSSDDLRADAAATRPSPTTPLEGKDKLPRPWSRGSVHGRHRLSCRRRNRFWLPRWEVALEAAPKPLRPESQTHGSCQRHDRRTPFPRSLREGVDRCPRGDRPQLGTLPSPALMMNILEAEGGAEAIARLASPQHRTGGHRLG
jgi:hypothetical protein